MFLTSDKFLVIAHGGSDEVTKARRILETTGAASVAAHDLKLGGTDMGAVRRPA